MKIVANSKNNPFFHQRNPFLFLFFYSTLHRQFLNKNFLASQTHGFVPTSDANGAPAPVVPTQIEVAPAVQADLQSVPQAPDVQDMQAPSLGRLNQFQGFYTPRPLPAGAQFSRKLFDISLTYKPKNCQV